MNSPLIGNWVRFTDFCHNNHLVSATFREGRWDSKFQLRRASDFDSNSVKVVIAEVNPACDFASKIAEICIVFNKDLLTKT